MSKLSKNIGEKCDVKPIEFRRIENVFTRFLAGIEAAFIGQMNQPTAAAQIVTQLRQEMSTCQFGVSALSAPFLDFLPTYADKVEGFKFDPQGEKIIVKDGSNPRCVEIFLRGLFVDDDLPNNVEANNVSEIRFDPLGVSSIWNATKGCVWRKEEDSFPVLNF